MIVNIFYVLLLASFASAKIPPYIQVCGRRNPNINECIKNSILKIKDKFADGIPELDVPSVNPLVVKRVLLVDLPNFKASAENLKIYGIHKFTIDDLQFHMDKKEIESVITFDKLRVEADYDVNAKILIPVVAHGPIEMWTDNVKAKTTMRYKVIQREGKSYAYFYSMTVKIEIHDYKANFHPNGDIDNTLATAINAALVDSKQEILDNTTPHIEKAISENMLEISNKVSQHFTYDELFPDRE